MWLNFLVGNHRVRLSDGRTQMVEFSGKVYKVTDQENQPDDSQHTNDPNSQNQQNQQNSNQNSNQGQIRGIFNFKLTVQNISKFRFSKSIKKTKKKLVLHLIIQVYLDPPQKNFHLIQANIALSFKMAALRRLNSTTAK